MTRHRVARPLIILGASVRAAARWALHSGYQPYAIDLFGDEDLRQFAQTVKIERYPSEFLPALAAAPQAPWMYTGGLENYPRLVARLSKLRPLIGNGPEVLRKVRDPRWLAEFVGCTAMKYPETVDPGKQLSGAWLLKPVRSGAGMGIQRRQCIPPGNPGRCVFQRYISGQPCSASFQVLASRVLFLGATQQWCGPEFGAPQEFQYAGSLAPLALSEVEYATLQHFAERLVAATGMQGMFGFDFIQNEQGLWLLEVNPRYTASMELFRGTLPTHECRAKLIVYADRDGSCGTSLRETMNTLRASGVDVADVPAVGTVFLRSQPICTLLFGGARVNEIRLRLQAAAARVRAELDA